MMRSHLTLQGLRFELQTLNCALRFLGQLQYLVQGGGLEGVQGASSGGGGGGGGEVD